MRDAVFLLLLVAFFAIATAYVRACAAVAGIEPSPPIREQGKQDEVGEQRAA